MLHFSTVRPALLLRRLLIPLGIAGVLAAGTLAYERAASAQQYVEAIPARPGEGYAWTPGYWGYVPHYGRHWHAGRWVYRGGHRHGYGGYARGRGYGGRGHRR
jgi:hypothetical protein